MMHHRTTVFSWNEMNANQAFSTNVASETVGFQDDLILRGHSGQIAFGLFRAQKRSSKAKCYRSRAHRNNSYDGKAEALRYLDRALTLWADEIGISWGWRVDSAQARHNQVLYVETPVGQCSFHSEHAYSDQRYIAPWDHSSSSEVVVLKFCDAVLSIEQPIELSESDLMPFGKHVGRLLGELESGYVEFLSKWEGIASWPSLLRYMQGVKV